MSAYCPIRLASPSGLAVQVNRSALRARLRNGSNDIQIEVG